MFIYRNANTGDEVEREERSPRLDHLNNWTLIGRPEERDADASQRPARNASEKAWRAHALANGRTEDELAGLKRDDLVALFPEE
ncbi:hypothetical protein [Actinomadura rubrisoli]|uniref:Uncharacterized protein n=1 Tax=Actinomadura rubrisoli TaxID=2530368 RepID=A0A4R5BUK2_9ACTN|nr:hypothetical protein [Actinomadura rubrisoli]TDD90778.1 hypothetical protein E1298_12820 [Actinomadura rubrisoli]